MQHTASAPQANPNTRLVVAVRWVAICAAVAGGVNATEASPYHARKGTWQETMLASRRPVETRPATPDQRRAWLEQLRTRIERDFPVQWDWALQDHGLDFHRWFSSAADTDIEEAMIARVLAELGPAANHLRAALDRLRRTEPPPDDRRWLDLYVQACEARREIRLKPLTNAYRRIVFTKHHNMGGSHYAYTEAQSDAQNERHFHPGTALCVLELDGKYGQVNTLIEDPDGVIRDPAVSYDGKRILFAWKKSDRRDDYHLYEMDVEAKTTRQVTTGLGFADYEGAYLPNGDIIFNSTRCVQTVDCWWTEVSNLYTCDADGKHLRRLAVDQVHTNFPTVTDDGRVLYTRWEYSDRGQVYPQPLYQMFPDGTGQAEFYGNNSWFPTTILHARDIPGTQKLVAVLSGHHTRQVGTLAIIDPSLGDQENSGVQEIAPVRETPAVHVDAYGQGGALFQYPYPVSETEFLVTYSPTGWARKPVLFAVYFMTIDGRRELLAADPKVSCNQPIPLAPRSRPHRRPNLVDHRKKTGVYYVQDVHTGWGLTGVPRGTIKRLRVVALTHRAAGIRSNRNQGPAGAALICTPISIGNGAWDVKIVLGDAEVHADGSACFSVPARTPVYFQALDAKGHAVQTMRTWSTLQPGEYRACVGCHERKSTAPDSFGATTLAARAGPQPLTPFHGPPRGFSFVREVQPILDRHCTRCHNDRTQRPPTNSPAVAHSETKPSPQPKRKTARQEVGIQPAGHANPGARLRSRLERRVSRADASRAGPAVAAGQVQSTRQLDQRPVRPAHAAALPRRRRQERTHHPTRSRPRRRETLARRDGQDRLLDRPARTVLRRLHRKQHLVRERGGQVRSLPDETPPHGETRNREHRAADR